MLLVLLLVLVMCSLEVCCIVCGAVGVRVDRQLDVCGLRQLQDLRHTIRTLKRMVQLPLCCVLEHAQLHDWLPG